MSAEPKFLSRRVCAGLYFVARDDQPDLEVEVVFHSKKDGAYMDGWQAIATWNHNVYSDYLETKKLAIRSAENMINTKAMT
jgi:hypothetical protein